MSVRKILLLFAFSVCIKSSFAQYLSFNMYEMLSKEDKKSSPTELENKYEGIIGSGFFSEGWVSGRAFTTMKMYNNLKLRFDVHTNTIYLNIHDTVYDITKSGIVQFDLFPNASDTTTIISFNNGYNFEEIKPETFVNVFSEGKVSFIKYYKKDIEEVYETSPTYKEKKFLDKNKYYIVENGTGKEVTVTKKNLEKALTDKWEAISKYAKEKNISAGNESGWKKLIDYYNTL